MENLCSLVNRLNFEYVQFYVKFGRNKFVKSMNLMYSSTLCEKFAYEIPSQKVIKKVTGSYL